MRWLIVPAAAAAVCGQSFDVKPAAVRQGETIHVRCPAPAASARMSGRTVRLFAQDDGTRFGLMPVPVATRPGKLELEILGADGGVLHTAAIAVRDARFPKQNIVLGKAAAELRPAPGEMETVAAFRENVSETRHWTEPLDLPVPGCVSSPFGVQRLYNGRPSGSYHSGVDQRSPAGRPVRAVAGGVVKIVREWNIHGGTVGIDHGQGLASIYLHMSKLAATEGSKVKKGDVVGYVGSTGRSTAPHLHWSLYANGVPVDPRQWLPLKACAAPQSKSKK
jgi:murein DD-endopeptidase MepM/ murein hydrolase activator NlpD